MQPALALLCLGATLLPAASGHLWAWMYSLPRHPPDEAALGRRAGPGDDLEEVSGVPSRGVLGRAGGGQGDRGTGSCSRAGSWGG